MATIEVYDPPMCCSTGVCGPDPDSELIRFAADLDWLRRQGTEVRRYNLAQEPAAFAANVEVKRLLESADGDGLPVIVVDGKVMGHGSYPSRSELAQWAGVRDAERGEDANTDLENGLITPVVAELIAIGAAIASNCETCFKYHYNQARKLGASKNDMIEGVNIALQVKDAPAQAMVRLAQRHLVPGVAASGSCCGEDSSGCCG